MSKNVQAEIPGTEKTAEEKAQEFDRLKSVLVQATGLPDKAHDIVRVLGSMSPNDIVTIATLCKQVAPRITRMGTIASELLAR